MDTQSQITETLEKLVDLRKVEKHFQSTMNQLDESYQKLDELHDILEKEYQDVKQIEGLSMKSLFHKVLGSKEDQMEKERQEYLQASLKYNEFKKTVELLEFERDLIKKKISDVSLYENKLIELKKKREKELLMSNSQQGKELMRIVHLIDNSISRRKELMAANQAGKEAAHFIKLLLQQLKKAKDWGSWDMMSNNRNSSYHKRGAIDNARDLSYKSKHALNRFQKELYDVGEKNYNLDINIGSFNTFMDVFFDNLISDWVIQQKIKNALHNVDGVYDKVMRLMQSVDHQIKKVDLELIELESVKDKIILNG